MNACEGDVVDDVHYEVRDQVAYVTIDRPAVMNAVDDATHARLNSIWSRVEQDRGLRAVVVTGAGERAFCVGADMSASAVTTTGLEYWAGLDPNGFGGLSLRRTIEIPVIARVNGYALGGGMEMVLGCDVVIAAETAQFGLPEPRVGRLPLAGGIHQLVRKIPRNRAMRILLSGGRFSAAQMMEFGLVNEVVPYQALDAQVELFLDDIRACAPSSIRAIKDLVTKTENMTAATANALRVSSLVEALDSADATEGVLAFQEKRPPQWRVL